MHDRTPKVQNSVFDLDRANKSSKLNSLKVREYSRLCADGVCMSNQQFLQPQRAYASS